MAPYKASDHQYDDGSLDAGSGHGDLWRCGEEIHQQKDHLDGHDHDSSSGETHGEEIRPNEIMRYFVTAPHGQGVVQVAPKEGTRNHEVIGKREVNGGEIVEKVPPQRTTDEVSEVVQTTIPAVDCGVYKGSVKGIVPTNHLRESEVRQIGNRLPLPSRERSPGRS